MVDLLTAPRGAVAPRDVRTARARGRRPALDGIRAVAVAGVVAYHLGGGTGSSVRGGYLGVDVFFVLSGYLISGLLLAEHRRRGRIDLAAFWFRRARRLVPAVLLVVVAVSGWVWCSQPPETWPARRADLLATLGYVANWHLAATSQDYFAGYDGASPVMHTWSLAIEEQFYLVWPLVLATGGALAARRWAGARGRRYGVALLAAGVLASAAWLAAAWSPEHASQAYYGTPGRVQELLAGAILALALPRVAVPARVAAVLAVAGLGGLVTAMAVLPAEGPLYFRGGALVVAALTVLLVAGVEAAPSSATARVLALRPVVALGVVSYGVYLWHWPVVVALPLPASSDAATTVRVQVVRLLLVAGLTVGSYLLVERPALTGRLPLIGPSRRRLVAVLATAYALAAAAAVAATTLPGSLAVQLADRADRACPGETADRLLACVKVDAGGRAPVLAVLGDSTARALAPGLDDEARRRGITWVQAAWQRCTATGLLIVPSGEQAPDAPARACAAQAGPAIDEVLERYRPDVVLVGETWSHDQDLLVGGERLPAASPAHRAALVRALTGLVDRVAAHGGRTVLLDLPPRGESLGQSVAAGRPAATPRPPDPSRRDRIAYNSDLAAVAAARPGLASVVSVTDVLCPGGARCPAIVDGMLARTDGIHYTGAFSRVVVPVLLDRATATPAGAALRPR